MRTVHEVSKLAGVSIRTLQYYDKIGLLHPAEHTESGYRLYDDADLERLQQILLFRELQFPLKEIKKILESPDFDRGKALEQQITLLTLKKERLEQLIDFARGIKAMGGKTMDFSVFDTKKMDEYAAKAKASWGGTPQYKEFEQKSEGKTAHDQNALWMQMMEIFSEFGQQKDQDPASAEVQKLVQRLQAFISEHFYTCSDDILSQLGKMYVGCGEFSENINKAGGAGTAGFVNEAIQIFCDVAP